MPKSKLPNFSPIESSMFEGYHYDPNTRSLTMKYKNGAVHRYADVTHEKVEAMAGSISPGTYFNKKIKGLHESTKIEQDDE